MTCRTGTAQLVADANAAKAEAWEEGYGDCWNYHTSEGAIGRQDNPYRNEETGNANQPEV